MAFRGSIVDDGCNLSQCRWPPVVLLIGIYYEWAGYGYGR